MRWKTLGATPTAQKTVIEKFPKLCTSSSCGPPPKSRNQVELQLCNHWQTQMGKCIGQSHTPWGTFWCFVHVASAVAPVNCQQSRETQQKLGKKTPHLSTPRLGPPKKKVLRNSWALRWPTLRTPRPATEPWDGPTQKLHEQHRKNTPARKSGLPEFTPKIPRKYQKTNPNIPIWGIFPNLLFLTFLDFQGTPCDFERFPLCSKDFRGWASMRNPHFGGFPGGFPKRQGKEDQGLGYCLAVNLFFSFLVILFFCLFLPYFSFFPQSLKIAHQLRCAAFFSILGVSSWGSRISGRRVRGNSGSGHLRAL